MTITTTDGESKSGTGKGKSGVRGATGSVREKASNAYSSTRERTSALYGSARDRASGVVSRETIQSNPVLAIAGGLAIGAILGAVLPRTRREEELLGDVGHRVTDAAKEAANSAVEAGRSQVDELKNSALQKVGSAVVEAVSGATGGGGNNGTTGNQ